MAPQQKANDATGYTVNCNGRLLSLDTPKVMGILNVTPDSFFADSRQQTEEDIARRTRQILDEGGAIIDVGACSTRPDSQTVGADEEARRLRMALSVVRREAPDAIVSVDTFRPDIARMVVEEYGADIINDVGPGIGGTEPDGLAARALGPSGKAGAAQWEMARMVSRLRVPYIYMSRGATVKQVLMDCARTVDQLRSLGQKDIILDPGFGFGKTVEQNYALLDSLERMQMTALPVLVGVSRKSMIWRLLGATPAQALNGTTALHVVALQKGASILRVHDVREAVECVKIVAALHGKP